MNIRINTFLMYVNICAMWNGKKPKIVGGFKKLTSVEFRNPRGVGVV